MSQAEISPAQAHDADHGHDHHGPEWLAHHFDTPDQQNTSAKLGMWVFLGTEILMFGGLFCAYAVWRANHFDAFWIGHEYLSTFWGAFNTVVLLVSSFTMAWAVRAAQLNQKNLCVMLMALTFLGGVGFMVVKTIEYSAKFSHGMGPGIWYTAPAIMSEYEKAQAQAAGDAQAADGAQQAVNPLAGTTVADPTEGPQGLVQSETGGAHGGHHAAGEHHGAHGHDAHGGAYYEAHGDTTDDLITARTFFSIYFGMTGLHGLHVLIGMGLIAWVMVRAQRGEFSSEYNTPVDLVGLYWHLVDLIWIFLFPLLYLI